MVGRIFGVETHLQRVAAQFDLLLVEHDGAQDLAHDLRVDQGQEALARARLLGDALEDATSLEVATYVSEDIANVEYKEGRFSGAKLRALTHVKIDGDTAVVVPETDGEVDTDLWKIHLEMLQQAHDVGAPVMDYGDGAFTMPDRLHVEHEGNVLLAMPAFAGDHFATKLVSVFPDCTPAIQGALLLNDGADGRPLALLEGAVLTALRTGAVSGLGIARTTPRSIPAKTSWWRG